MGRDREGGKKEGWKGRRKDLPDQCQTASYAPGLVYRGNSVIRTAQHSPYKL